MNQYFILNFLKELKSNNYRDWFLDHKEEYLKAKTSFEELTQEFILVLGQIDSTLNSLSPQDCIFRIYRDIRFSPDKSPYKTHMGTFLAPGGRKSPYAGYYLHLEPGGSFLGGGIYCPESKVLRSVRQNILDHFEEFETIVTNPHFQQLFPNIHGEKLKTVPRGFPKDWPHADWLKYKSYTILYPLTDQQILSDNLIQDAMEIFSSMRPFNHFLNEAFRK